MTDDTGDAPLSAERVSELDAFFSEFAAEDDTNAVWVGVGIADAGRELLTAYTALAAQLAAARAERDALRAENVKLREQNAVLLCDNALLVPPATWREYLASLATPARPTDTGRDG